jgi:hypothetical protein
MNRVGANEHQTAHFLRSKMFLLRRGARQSSVRRSRGCDLLRVFALEEEVFDPKYVLVVAFLFPDCANEVFSIKT